MFRFFKSIFFILVALGVAPSSLCLSAGRNILDGPYTWRITSAVPSDNSEGDTRKLPTRGRIPFVIDPVMETLAGNSEWIPDWPDSAESDENGKVSHTHLRNGWAATVLEVSKPQTALLKGKGFSAVFVNGDPFGLDIYSLGILRIPIPLKKGKNSLIVKSTRGSSFTLSLEAVGDSLNMNREDALLPDLRSGTLLEAPGAVVILNQTDRLIEDARLVVGGSNGFALLENRLQPVLPYGLIKAPFTIRQLRPQKEMDFNENHGVDLPLQLISGEQVIQRLTLSLKQVQIDQNYKVTRISEIDGSVQYYSVRPPIAYDKQKTYSLYLSLHGASVEATRQAAAHYSKYNAFTLAPTNRRPFGFDWQEWGRMDALESLTHFLKLHSEVDQQRIYLTGHSMGGHGTWYLGALYPSRWAAIGPSAGWVSFFSYGGGVQPGSSRSILEPLERSKNESDTLALLTNYLGLPVYPIHGDSDRTVPIAEMDRMVELLEPIHDDLQSYRHPGGGHWYDPPDHPGAECMDWKPRNDFFQKRVTPTAPTTLSFKTQNPWISSGHFWVKVLQQLTSGDISSIEAEFSPNADGVNLKTDNIRAFSLDFRSFLSHDRPLELNINSQELTALTENRSLTLSKESGRWKVVKQIQSGEKSPERFGPFKAAFENRMIWVYGTHGTSEENKAGLAQVRFDQQRWWYRGNGNVLVIPDTLYSVNKYPDRNVILFGHADMNSAFKAVLPDDCPVEIHREEAKVNGEIFTGSVGAYFLYPRKDSSQYSVAVVGASSVVAIRRNFLSRFYTSGVSLPDYTLFGAGFLEQADNAVLACGYFDNNWRIKLPSNDGNAPSLKH